MNSFGLSECNRVNILLIINSTINLSSLTGSFGILFIISQNDFSVLFLVMVLCK